MFSFSFTTTTNSWVYKVVSASISKSGYSIVSVFVNQLDTSVVGGTNIFANVFSSSQLFIHCYANSSFDVSGNIVVLYKKNS